jgi:hypothetical protein
MAENPWDCVEVLAVKPVPHSRVGEHQITYRIRNGETRDWTVRAKDELDAFNKTPLIRWT